MPLMPLTQARVVDQVLTNLSHGYTNNSYIGRRLAPPVAVQEYGGTTITFDRSSIIEDDYGRAPGAEFKQVSKTYDGNPYKLKQKGLKYPVPIEHQTDTQRLGIQWDQIATEDMMERLLLDHEIETATAFTTTGNYLAANRATLSGTSQWSDPASDPKGDIRAAKSAIKKSAGARGDLILWVGENVMNALQEHPDILDTLKHTTSEPVTEDMLARYFRISAVVVGDAVKKASSSATEEYVWGNNAGLVVVNSAAGTNGGSIAPNGDINRFTPSFAYTYTLEQEGQAHPYQYPVEWNKDKDCWEYKMRYDRSVELTGIESGYLWSAAVA